VKNSGTNGGNQSSIKYSLTQINPSLPISGYSSLYMDHETGEKLQLEFKGDLKYKNEK
jgi:hypothetical protein